MSSLDKRDPRERDWQEELEAGRFRVSGEQRREKEGERGANKTSAAEREASEEKDALLLPSILRPRPSSSLLRGSVFPSCCAAERRDLFGLLSAVRPPTIPSSLSLRTSDASVARLLPARFAPPRPRSLHVNALSYSISWSNDSIWKGKLKRGGAGQASWRGKHRKERGKHIRSRPFLHDLVFFSSLYGYIFHHFLRSHSPGSIFWRLSYMQPAFKWLSRCGRSEAFFFSGLRL